MHLWRLYFILPNLFSILVCNPFFFQSIFPGSWIKKAYEEIQKATEILKNALWKGNVMVDGIRENNINHHGK